MVNLYTSEENKSRIKPKPALSEVTASNPGQVKLGKNEPHILASFHETPEGISFANQNPNEKVILFLRRHYITNLDWEVATLIFIILPLLAFAILPYLNLSLIFDIPSKYIFIITLFYYVIVFGYAFVNFVVWFYNVGIISSQRVIDIDVNGISSKNVAAADIKDIVDISYRQNGLKQSLFDYGDVFMETQGEKPNFEFLNIPHPARVTDLVTKLDFRHRK